MSSSKDSPRASVPIYALIYKFGMPANTIHRMKHGKPITTTTLNALCEILNCGVEAILVYEPDGERDD